MREHVFEARDVLVQHIGRGLARGAHAQPEGAAKA